MSLINKMLTYSPNWSQEAQNKCKAIRPVIHYSKPQASMNECGVSEQEGKARTICEITESVASTIFQFFGSRNWQRYNDGETQPEGTQNKPPPKTQWDRKGSQDIQGDVYIL
jgi:hypothetical protein